MSKKNKMILTAGPSITEKEIYYVLDAVKNGWNENWNSYIIKFENWFKNFLGVKYALSTSSCTGAMHLALAALNIKEGDEVLVPEITWVATASVVKYVGATPVFVDVDLETWTMDLDDVIKKISNKTKAIIPVHIYGNPCYMDELINIAREYNLYVVEDAAAALGASYNGKKIGKFGDFAAFSFQGAKTFVTGEGGMLVTNNDDLYKKVKILYEHGRNPKPDNTFWIERIGFKYKMSNLQAALGLAQVERKDELIDKKIKIHNWYKKKLEDLPYIDFQKENPKGKSVWWMTSIVLKEKLEGKRYEIMKILKEKYHIDTRPVFPPISSYPMWKTFDSPNANLIGLNGINLPSGHNLTEEDIDFIVEALKEIIEKMT